MADVQHATLPDNQLHYPKGAAGASANTWLRANGDGTTSFTTLPTPTFDFQDSVTSISTATQWLTSTDTEAVILFDTQNIISPQGSVTINLDGTIVFNETGVYEVAASGSCGRDAGSGVATLLFSARINDTQIGRTYEVSIDSANDSAAVPIANSTLLSVEAGDTLTYHMRREGSAVGNAGLRPYITTAVSGWGDVASAHVSVSLVGVTNI